MAKGVGRMRYSSAMPKSLVWLLLAIVGVALIGFLAWRLGWIVVIEKPSAGPI